MLNFFNSLFRKETPQPTVDVLNYIPFQFVEDWKPGDRITVAGESAEIYVLSLVRAPQGTQLHPSG